MSALTDHERERLPQAPAPRRAAVMKAVLTHERFSAPGWIFERKLDGIRCVAVRDRGPVRLLSRNDRSLNARFPEIAAALDGQAAQRFALDGELVAFAGSATSFAALAQRGHRPVRVYLYAFDLVWLDGIDVRSLPLRRRKALLRSALRYADPLRLSAYRNERGVQLFERACRSGWEGLIAKRADSPYVEGRSRDWRKLKCEHGQELVIGGFTAPRGSRTELGALLVGYHEDGRLRYAGKVGTGFTTQTLHELAGELLARRRPDPPFADPEQIRERNVTWVAPELVAQIGFAEWTSHGRLRHPRFLGLREDKAAAEVVRER